MEKELPKNTEVLWVVESLSNSKGIEKEDIFLALETALKYATEKRHREDISVQVDMDRDTGNYDTFRVWEVVDDEEFDPCEERHTVTLSKAREQEPAIEVGQYIREPMESMKFGRIAVHAAKHIIVQKVREAERKELVKKYSEEKGKVISAKVKAIDRSRNQIFLDLGENVEALLTKDHMLPGESFRVGDRIRAYLYDVHYEPRGPQLFVSRTEPNMLIELFKVEVPEIGDNVIEIKSAAREPGIRAKIAVKTNDGRIDPIGACVGMRGSRVQAVSGELGGERIDIILWDDNPAQLVINAMAPAEVESIVVDVDSHTIDVAVSAEQLSQAIGRNGQNVRLASELTGWILNVMSTDEMEQKAQAESMTIAELFIEKLGVDEDVAGILVEEGFTSLEEVAYVPLEEMLEIEDFDEGIAETLQSRAKDALLTEALTSEEELSSAEPAEDLLTMEGMEKQ